MIIHGRGTVISGASFSITKETMIYDVKFTDCSFDDSCVDHKWADRCIFVNCHFASNTLTGTD